MQRRSFIKHSSTFVSASLWAPAFVKTELSQGPGKILVVIQLSGGNDGLNTIIPYADDEYYRARPSLGIAADQVLKLDDRLGLNPALEPLRSLYDEGSVSIINAVGYPNPNRSHFRSMDIWQTASDAHTYLSTGWLGRYLDSECEGCTIPYHAIEMGDNLSLALRGETRDGFAMRDAERLVRSTQNPFLQKMGQRYQPDGSHDHLDYLYKTMVEVQESASYLSEKARSSRSREKYPTHGFGRGLKQIADLILAGSNTRVYYLSLPGFDTHVNQVSRHSRLLKIYAQGMQAFTKDMRANRLFDDVAVITFSEFGRRVAENGSRGTDHGAANNVLLLGGALRKPGIFNGPPDLDNLDEGDVRFQIDFRSIYANVLQNWLDTDPTMVLGSNIVPQNLL